MKQIFPYVKAALMNLHDSGKLNLWPKRIIGGDGGPGHFKVYKTQGFMSEWVPTLTNQLGTVYYEWNMLFANMGHNLCDAHAGHMKRKVRKAENDYKHMYNIDNIISEVKSLKNTEVIVLSYETIISCEEPPRKPVGGGFIKKYHHFRYVSTNILLCQYIKGVGPEVRHELINNVTKNTLELCGICGDPEDPDNDPDRNWIECEDCKQWYHCDCFFLDEDDDEQMGFFVCGCIGD